MEFSKKIVIFFVMFLCSILGTSFYIMYKIQDISALGEIIIGTFGMGTIILGFYFWKAKSENIVKIMNEHGESVADKVKDL